MAAAAPAAILVALGSLLGQVGVGESPVEGGGQTHLPAAVRAMLDRDYPGWRPAGIAPQIAEWFRERGFRHEPDRIAADFDADGAEDFAVSVRFSGLVERQVVLAFLSRGDRFERHVLADDPPDPFIFLLLFARGTPDFDFETMRPFRHARDTVAIMYFQRNPLVFTYSDGSFRKKVMPSDEEI